MQLPAVRVGSSPREVLSAGWQIRSAAPGEFADPGALPSEGWHAVSTLGTAAACERDAGRWSLDDAAARSFDRDDWWYRLAFDIDAPSAAARHLRFEGLATLAQVWLNGELLLSSDNMFVEHDCPLPSGLLRSRGNELVMAFRSIEKELTRRRPRPAWRVPMLEQQQLRWIRTTLLGRTPGWSPPAAAVGPWRDVVLLSDNGWRVDERLVRASVDSAGNGRLDVEVLLAGIEQPVESIAVELIGPSGADGPNARLDCGGLVETAPGRWRSAFGVTAPALWWPHTHGSPATYQVQATVRGATATSTVDLGAIGFRRIEADTGGEGFAVNVNGVAVFCRGACWTPVDPASLRHDRAALRQVLERARDAGMNMLRIGGTMVYEDDAFFETCDSLGILVWQDFMFANMDYPSADPEFRSSVEREVRGQMRRWGHHASLAVLCGNSEVSQQSAMWGAGREAWAPDLFHEFIPALVAAQLPGAVYWPSSAWGGAFPHQVDAGTTSYYGVGAYLRPFDDARRSCLRFATECLGFSNIPGPETIERMPGGASLRVTHAPWKARASRDLTAGWDFEDVRDHYLRELFAVDPAALRYADHARYLALSRATSGEVMAAAFSEWRRNASSCSGALVWFLRDLWAGAGWGVLDDQGMPKPCWHALSRVLQPLAVLVTDEGNNGLAAHVVNERPEAFDGTLTVQAWRGDVSIAYGQLPIRAEPRASAAINVASALPHFMDLSHAFRFGPRAHDAVVVTLGDASGAPVSQAFHFPGGMSLPLEADLGLVARSRPLDGGAQEVTVVTRRLAVGVHFETPGFMAEVEYFHLAPNAERRIVFRPVKEGKVWRGVVQALNATQPSAITASA